MPAQRRLPAWRLRRRVPPLHQKPAPNEIMSRRRTTARMVMSLSQREIESNMAVQKIRIYDLAKELKLDNKRVIDDARREGIDVSVPSNTVPMAVAERIRTKY